MKKITLFLFISLFCVVEWTYSQQYNDGAMDIEMWVGFSWTEDGDGSFLGNCDESLIGNCEYSWIWSGADNANLDGTGFTSSQYTFSNTSSDGWINSNNYKVFDHVYGTPGNISATATAPAVPQFLQLHGESWEDDCFECFRCTGTFFGACISAACDQCDRHVYEGGCPCSTAFNIFCTTCTAEDKYCNTVVKSDIDYRTVPPCIPVTSTSSQLDPNWVGDYASTSCGNDDIGAEILAYYTPPSPSFISTTQTALCEPGLVTLSTSGAIYGGDYIWYNDNTGQFVGIGATITPIVTQTTTFKVHTFNGDTSCKSLTAREITITLTSAPAIQSVSTSNPTCSGNSDGTITINASTSSGNLFYSIDNGVTFSSNNTFNVGSGNYLIKVRNSAGCEVPDVGALVQIIDPTPLSATITNTVDVSCHGEGDGWVDLSVNGGTPPYSFVWQDNVPTTISTNEDLIDASAGAYSVQITDANGCTQTANASITEPTNLTATATGDSVTCSGHSDGYVDLTVSGGTPPYSYLWSNGSQTEDVTNVSGNIYTAQVHDDRGCISTASYTVYEPTAIMLDAILSHILCLGGAGGSIDLSVSGGNGGYTYIWNDGTTNFATTEDISGLQGGTYTVTVTDRKGCQSTESYTIQSPSSSIILSTTVDHVSCRGESNGSVDLTIIGGTPPYSVSWMDEASSTISNSEDILGLSGGWYYVEMTDLNGCYAEDSLFIDEPDSALSASMSTVDVLCHGDETGEASVTPQGGTQPYTYLWSTFDTTHSIPNQPAGPVSVIVTDANQCEIHVADTIDEPASLLSLKVQLIHVDCFGENTGSLDITVLGGTPPFTYAWSNSSTDEDIDSIYAGIYSLTVTDGNGCSTSEIYQINQPDELVSSVNTTSPDCPGQENGMALAGVNGGEPPYHYEWSTNPVQYGVLANSLVGNQTYYVTISDQNNCLIIDSALVTDPPEMEIFVDPSDESCFLGSDGEVSFFVLGGLPPYSYELNGIYQEDSTYTGLSAGNYIVFVEDNMGCIESITFDISTISDLRVDLLGNGFSDHILAVRNQPVELGVSLINATSNTEIAGYSWEPSGLIDMDHCPDPENCPNPIIFVDENTIVVGYVWEVVHGDTCLLSDSLLIETTAETLPFIPSAFSPNGDGINDQFTVNFLGAENISTRIYDRWGEEIYYNANQQNGVETDGWDGTYKGNRVPLGTYVYQINVTYFDQSAESYDGTITLIR